MNQRTNPSVEVSPIGELPRSRRGYICVLNSRRWHRTHWSWRLQSWAIGATMILGSLALVAAADAVDDAREEIRASNEAYAQAMRRGDVQGQLELYTEDARVIPPLVHPVVGRAAIESYLRQETAKSGDQPVNPDIETLNLEVVGEIAIETGRSTITVGNLPPVKGHYLVVWKKTQGKWKIHREMWNFSTSHEEGFLKIMPGDRLETPDEK